MKKKIAIVIIIIAIMAISAGLIVNKIKTENRKYEIAQIINYKYFVSKEKDKYGTDNRSKI